jgi:uncharacterized membrane protein
MKYITKKLLLLLVICAACIPSLSFAQEVYDPYQGTYRGRVIEIVDEEMRELPGLNTPHLFQTLEVKILNGPQKESVITISNDYLELDTGDRFFFNYDVDVDGTERYTVITIDRRASLVWLFALFVAVIVFFARWQGVRSLVALGLSFLAIIYVLIPGILNGWNPLFASFLVAAGILFAAIYFTHGFNRESTVAYTGTMLAVIITGIIAIISVNIADLSGFTGDETTYLNFNTQGLINFQSLLLGAIIIGILGVLDDIAVTQAAVVTELYNSNKDITPKEVYTRAMRVGREHVGALVNTLVLAYTGVSLPLVLYFSMSPIGFGSIVNLEIFATEIVRMIISSIGLVLTVPIVTGLAVLYLKNYTPKHSHKPACAHGHHH